MKNLLFLLVALASLNLHCQTTIVDNSFKIEYKKAIKNSRLFELHTSSSFVQANENEQKIQIRFKVKSTSKKKVVFDPNKFYLISDEYKFRERPVDIKHDHVMTSYLGFEKLVDEISPEENKNSSLHFKEHSIKDTFNDYKVDGYKDIEITLNYGTTKKPVNKIVYFNHKKIKSKTVDVYFIVPLDFDKGKIYYGNQLLIDFILD